MQNFITLNLNSSSHFWVRFTHSFQGVEGTYMHITNCWCMSWNRAKLCDCFSLKMCRCHIWLRTCGAWGNYLCMTFSTKSLKTFISFTLSDLCVHCHELRYTLIGSLRFSSIKWAEIHPGSSIFWLENQQRENEIYVLSKTTCVFPVKLFHVSHFCICFFCVFSEFLIDEINWYHMRAYFCWKKVTKFVAIHIYLLECNYWNNIKSVTEQK